MPITGSQPALMYARLGVARLGATRLDYIKPILKFTIGGVSAGRLRVEGMSIEDLLNSTPNRATFRVSGITPVEGQEVKIGLGELDTSHLVFAGHIVQTTQVYEADNPAKIAHDVQATSYEMRLNGRRVTKTYGSQSATTTLRNLFATYTIGFDTSGIAPNLPIIPELTFVDARFTDVIDEVMERVGGSSVVDYGQTIHAFLTSSETVNPISDGDVHGAREIVKTTDITQQRNRITVRGKGSRTTAPIDIGFTSIPIQDASAFALAGGTAFHGTQEFTYTAKVAGGTGSNVEGMAGPGSAPTAALTSGIGDIIGAVSYKVAFKNSQGITMPGPASNTVTGVAVTPPGAGLTLGLAAGIGRLAGTYLYAVTNVTARGETTLGSFSSPISPAAVATPAAPTIASGGFGRLVGDYRYKVTLVTPHGETLASVASSLETATPVAAPGGLSTAEVSSTIGVLIGAYNYKTSFVTTHGETLPSSTAASRTVSAQSAPSAPTLGEFGVGPLIGTYKYKIAFVSALGETVGTASSDITPDLTVADAPTVGGSGTGLTIAYAVTWVHPVFGESELSSRTIDSDKGTNPVVTVNNLPSGCGWNIYTTGTVTAGTGGSAPLYKIAEMGPGTSSFTHIAQTGPEIDGIVATLGEQVAVTSIPTGPTGTVARRIYRTKAGGSDYFLVGQIDNNNSGVGFDDNVPDESLTERAPVLNPNGKQIALSSIPTGPSSTLARRIYRTKAGGAQYFLLTELADNVEDEFTDNTPDDSLTTSAPLVATAGGEKHTVTIPTGPSGTLARRIYRTDAGGTVYKQLVEIPNNIDTSYSDDNPDSALGGGEPLVSTAGGQNVSLTGIPTGPAGTVRRRLYRTKAGGAEYFLLDEIPDNVTGTYTDSREDTELTVPAPTVNDAGASRVALTSVPLGPAGITERLVYRTRAGGGDYFLVGRIGDNTTTTFDDDAADDSLHELAPTVSTIGGLAGDVSLKLVSAAEFSASGGWARADSQVIRYTGKSGNTITGIPATGTGALVAAIDAGSAILVEPHLTGVSTLVAAIPDGEDVRILVRVEDTTAQTALAAALGVGDGVVEETFNESELSVTEATDYAEAQLALLKDPLESIRYVTRDKTTKTGSRVTFNLAAPTDISGTYTIQSVRLDDFSADGSYLPRRTVEAGSRHFSFEALLRQARGA
jgi:hypothetical protein